MVISVDLIGRLLLIERREALAWGFDPTASTSDPASDSASYASPTYGTFPIEAGLPTESVRQSLHSPVPGEFGSTDALLNREASAHGPLKVIRDDPIPFLEVIRRLFMSSRAMAAVANSFVYGYVAQWHMKPYRHILLDIMCRILYSFQEPTLPVHLQRTWHLNSSQVGLVFFGASLPAMIGRSDIVENTCDE